MGVLLFCPFHILEDLADSFISEEVVPKGILKHRTGPDCCWVLEGGLKVEPPDGAVCVWFKGR